MSWSVTALLLLDFIFIGLLPRVFFRQDGTFNLRWWATATPFFVNPAVLVAGAAGVLDPLGPEGRREALEVAAVVPAVASIALLFMTLGTHRIPLALWHQDDDEPHSIVTYGAYSRIRHPFYTSFILAFLAALIAFPHWATLALLVYAAAALNLTAAREERRLSSSQFGAEYTQYMARTGRFLPRPVAHR
ncbi:MULTISPECIES: methyltransferase family protein [Thermomonospora]|uniref:Protein-S-isoprenylcysteine O-methyltransferase Ste14 n=1 Tax=Thermomonospora cellulosilytica TaxID=1411118 RepID=A0A7W3N3B2_9ACTN|nr:MULTISPECIES: isoprenylcysteine carboxylmethyltransferase family protein [Thermomonospora]MBA9006786.1 protein-S-isoprenylcysteine O-methyltransferase Ste14 [Thermomonospora cellulosilytica]